MKAKSLRLLASLFLLTLGISSIAFVASASGKYMAGNRDFIAYWAAGQQLVHGANPYSRTAVLHLEKAQELSGDQPLVMRNPPLAFFLALPLGFVSEQWGMVLWLLMLVGALMASVRMLWILNGRPGDRLHLLGYLFAPALACVMAGQIGIVLLLGMTIFLYWHRRRPFLAGAALLLCSVKPHLFLAFGAALLAWALSRKAYRVLAGAATAIAASGALSMGLDFHAWAQYARMMLSAGIQGEFVPSLSLLFRLLVDRGALWLQFVPAAAACVWAIWYFRTRRDRWNWMEHGLLLLLVSVATAPYAWFTDEVVVLPAILAALYRASGSGRRVWPFGFFSGIALVEVMERVPLTSGFYLWTMPAWIAWYLYATHGQAREAEARVSGPLFAARLAQNCLYANLEEKSDGESAA
ncbi:MAG TPA: glycosyltransferase family 87 protein [Terracidiphilus sp.]|nr:glycosyltransferase family 87 protein [Terracidiphilus sp.]